MITCLSLLGHFLMADMTELQDFHFLFLSVEPRVRPLSGRIQSQSAVSRNASILRSGLVAIRQSKTILAPFYGSLKSPCARNIQPGENHFTGGSSSVSAKALLVLSDSGVLSRASRWLLSAVIFRLPVRSFRIFGYLTVE